MSDIDREVAEKVMGWRFQPHLGAGTYNVAHDQIRWANDWSPSTRIDHAWEVVEKLRHRAPGHDQYTLMWGFELTWHNEDGCWYASFLDEGGEGREAGGETAPLAICKAALAAVGEKG